MWTVPAPAGDPRYDDGEHQAARLVELSGRIARLAIALGVNLDDTQQVSALLQRVAPVAVERRVQPDRRTSDRPGSPDRRVAHKHAELRGLVLMRYSLELNTIDALGATAAQQVLRTVAQALEHEGFPPGAAGLRLHVLPLDA